MKKPLIIVLIISLSLFCSCGKKTYYCFCTDTTSNKEELRSTFDNLPRYAKKGAENSCKGYNNEENTTNCRFE